jgi:spore germination protein YaaH
VTPRKISAKLAAALVAASLAFPLSAAAADLEVAGWIPYWKAKEGAKDALAHLDQLDALFPFAFTVKKDGSLKDEGKLSKSTWKKLFDAARKDGVPIIPTIMSGDGALVGRILADEDSRADHIEAIVKMVEKGKYDGVDIDYEGKKSSSRDDFSAFLTELGHELDALGDGKILSCTIEARTPPEALYRDVPATVAYSNDYAVIADACDRINVMTYDQQRADLVENSAKKGEPYFPMADVDWVRKVAELALESLPAEKIHLGVATYGRELEVTVAPEWYRDYDQLWAFNPGYAEKLAKKKKIEIYRAKSGEAAFSYFEDRKIAKKMAKVEVPDGTPEGLRAAAQALAYANETGEDVVVNYATWSDAEAIEQKIDLARELGLAGIAIFKIDGGEDKGVWSLVD